MSNLCQQCNASLPPDSKFCPQCAAPVVQDIEPKPEEQANSTQSMSRCFDCNTLFSGSSYYCPKCLTMRSGQVLKRCSHCDRQFIGNSEYCIDCFEKRTKLQSKIIESLTEDDNVDTTEETSTLVHHLLSNSPQSTPSKWPPNPEPEPGYSLIQIDYQREHRRKSSSGQTFGKWIVALALGALLYFSTAFDSTVEVPTQEVLGQTIGGGRVHNIGLMQDKENGVIISISVCFMGIIMIIYSRHTPRSS